MNAQEALKVLFEVDYQIMHKVKNMPNLGESSIGFKALKDHSRQELYELIHYYVALHEKEMHKNTELKIEHVHEMAAIEKYYSRSFIKRILGW